MGDQVEIIYFEGDTSWIYIPGSAPMGVSMHGFNIGFYLFWYVFSMGGIAVAFVTLLKKYGTKFVKQDDMILNYFREASLKSLDSAIIIAVEVLVIFFLIRAIIKYVIFIF